VFLHILVTFGSTRFVLAVFALASCSAVALRSLSAQSAPAALEASRYSNAALAALVQEASVRNKLPVPLQGYSVNVETEIALIIRRADGTEVTGSVEQVASTLRWARTGLYDQRVQGHRVQQAGLSVSMLSLFRVGWLNPTLYGNRLRARQNTTSVDSSTAASERSARAARRSDAADTAAVVHPLAADRDRWYTYSGGDTVVTLQAGERRIPIVRVQVQPRDGITERGSLFRGELHLDASRGALVRMRGAFVRVGNWPQPGGLIARVSGSLVDAVAFIDYENAEREQAYWLPTVQRIELQATAPMATDGRAVIRIVSRFRDMAVDDTLRDSARVIALADSPPPRMRRRLTFAPPDSLNAFDRWAAALGAMSQGLHSDDFDAFGPDRWRPSGAPRFDWGVPQVTDLFRFNRVEGVFTGFGGRLALRDLAPGTTLRVTAGYAWNEQAVRGRVEVQRDRGPWRLMARAGRSLDITNDFRNPLDSGSSLGALSGQDEYDYVDRTFAGVQAVRTIGAREWQWRVETGVARDDGARSQLAQTPLGRLAFRENRSVDNGTYFRNALTLAWRPDGSAEFMRPGWSGRLYAENGAGEIDYTRFEARLTARRVVGPFTAVARADAGVLLGASLPTQQLFELGRSQGLPGYEYKVFAGTQSSVVRGLLLWTGPWLRQPTVIGGGLFLPPLAPGVSVAVQSGWTGAPGAAAREAVNRLGSVPDSADVLVPVSTVSESWRSSVSAGFRLFSGSVFVGGAQPLERGERFRWLVTFGQVL